MMTRECRGLEALAPQPLSPDGTAGMLPESLFTMTGTGKAARWNSRHAKRSLEFALHHTFEETFARRVTHLSEIAASHRK
jgi:hypothetical protein